MKRPTFAIGLAGLMLMSACAQQLEPKVPVVADPVETEPEGESGTSPTRECTNEIDDVDVLSCERAELLQFARTRRATLHAMMLTCRLWHHAASSRRFDVLELRGGHLDVRSVCNQLHTGDEGIRQRVRVVILDSDLVGVSSGLVKVLFSLCPRVDTIVADAHLISSITSYPPSAKRMMLGEAELVVAIRLLAGATIRHLSIEQCHRRVDGLTASEMDLSSAASRHLERLEVSFAVEQEDRSEGQDLDSERGDEVVETMPSTLEWVIVNGYRLKQLKLAGCGTRAVNSALRKLNRIANEDEPTRADGLEIVEISLPAREKNRGFVRDINAFMPSSLTDYVLHCSNAFDAASVAADLVSDFFSEPSDELPELDRIAILTDTPPDDDTNPEVTRHLDLAFADLQTACDQRGITLERPTLCA